MLSVLLLKKAPALKRRSITPALITERVKPVRNIKKTINSAEITALNRRLPLKTLLSSKNKSDVQIVRCRPETAKRWLTPEYLKYETKLCGSLCVLPVSRAVHSEAVSVGMLLNSVFVI